MGSSGHCSGTEGIYVERIIHSASAYVTMHDSTSTYIDVSLLGKQCVEVLHNKCSHKEKSSYEDKILKLKECLHKG